MASPGSDGRTPSARFDDLTNGRSFAFSGLAGQVVAERPDEVADAIAAVEAAARRGLWAAGFVSYEAAPGFDPSLRVRPPADHGFRQPPLVWFGLFEDRAATSPPLAGAPAEPHAGPGPPLGWWLDSDLGSYRRRLEKVRAHISAGDTYQLNLTERWRCRLAGDPADLYRSLVLAQQPSYGALIDTGDHVIASASPELLFEWRPDALLARPMKGTAARGRWPEEDQANAARLRASPKEQAENVMIVDLVRSDLGRVAAYGSVRVTELCVLERYPTIWQLTSGVRARPREGTTLLDVFRALFPSGSVTGAPKCRTMELITEVEADRRGPYCGAVGFVGPGDVRARFNVGIRTAVIDLWTGEAVYGSGGGIVWDSDPEREYAELVAKARILVTEDSSFELIETMAFVPGDGLRNRARHLQRMAASAEYFGFSFCPLAAAAGIDRALEALVAPSRVRVSLARSGALRVETGPLPRSPGPVRLAFDDEPVDSHDVDLFHKTTRRRRYLERRARYPEADDVVAVNERGEVTETTIANLAVYLDGTWCTPPLDAGCLPGVERARALEQGLLVERAISGAELLAAQSVMLVSSLRGWRPALVVGLEPSHQ